MNEYGYLIYQIKSLKLALENIEAGIENNDIMRIAIERNYFNEKTKNIGYEIERLQTKKEIEDYEK